MTKRVLLENYRDIVIEIETLERQSKFLNQFIGGPRPVHGTALTGMPRGTNDPEAAMLQTTSIEDEILERIREKQALQYEMMREAYRIIDAIRDQRLQNIVRSYYLHGMTDEQIAEDEGLSHTHVNRLRTDYFNNLI